MDERRPEMEKWRNEKNSERWKTYMDAIATQRAASSLEQNRGLSQWSQGKNVAEEQFSNGCCQSDVL